MDKVIRRFPSDEKEYQRAYYKKNAEKIKARMRKWYANHLGYRQNQNLKRSFGITLNDYNKMLKEQKGVCAICGEKETRKNKYGVKSLAVDHNHKTDKIRGLLCMRCNLFIGGMKEDINMVLKVVDYLKNDGVR